MGTASCVLLDEETRPVRNPGAGYCTGSDSSKYLLSLYTLGDSCGGRAGHLFQGRYKVVLVDAGSYLLGPTRYIQLNPVRSGIVREPENYLDRYSKA